MKANAHHRLTRFLAFAAVLAAGTLLAGNFFSPNNQPYGTVAGLAASSTVLTSGGEVLYAPYFEEESYGGDLMALPVSALGVPSYLQPIWRASETLGAVNWNTGRNIVTTDGAGNAIPFGWDTLTTTQRAALDPDTAADPGETARTDSPILNFLRGDRSREAQNGGTFRDRTSVLGDIIHPSPLYVAQPKDGHLNDDYPAFAAANAGRAPRVYAAANDGMLHAFDAATGAELFAYIPSILIGKMSRLTRRPYLHEYMVDGPFTVRDAYFGGAWHTVLVGGLGAGGQGFYALDVTSAEDAASSSETVAAAKVLWEYDEDDDANVGFTYGRPSIVRLEHDGSWVALLANGYVNTAADGRAGDGKARLIAIDVATGAKRGEVAVSLVTDSPGDPNGLSSPTAVDTDGDALVDTVFAGDIKGNLWRFDISGDPATWSDADATHLFAAKNGPVAQSITTAPEVALHPADATTPGLDLLVLLGTGRLFDTDDYNTVLPTTDSVYGLWIRETMPGPLDTSDLLEQTLTEATHANGTRVRTVSDNGVDWSTHDGWVLDLPQGERLLGDPQLRRGRLQMTTTNPMAPSGENWFMSVSYKDGGAPETVVMDIDGDAVLTIADNVDGNGDGDAGDPEDRVVGQYQQFGLASQPLLVALDSTRGSALINHLNALSPIQTLPESNDPADLGLRGGHFDLDVSTDIYDFDKGKTDKHTHEWDDKTGLNFVNFLNIPKCTGKAEDCLENPELYVNDNAYTDFREQITDPNQQFRIIVANSALSPGGVIEINGSSVPVTAYEQMVRLHAEGVQLLPVYQLGPNPPPGVQQLTSFKLSFSANAILQGGLIGTVTGCVRKNTPGALGEYRNGALTVQVIDASSGTVAPGMHYATAGLLWESTAFWHWKGACYGTTAWTEDYQTCVIEGDVCECLEKEDAPTLCGIKDETVESDTTDDGSVSAGDTEVINEGCTVTALNANPRTWNIELEKPLCGQGPVVPVELKLEFEKKLKDDQVTTITVHYGGSSQSITFTRTEIHKNRVGSPIQFDLTGMEIKGDDVKKIKLRNVGGADIEIDRVEISWTGGDTAQKLKKVKVEKPDKKDYTSGLPGQSPAIATTDIDVRATVDNGACEYTLSVDYTLPTGGTGRSTHTFDAALSGIGGYPLEIDMDASELADGRDVLGVRLRSLLDDAITITGLEFGWNGGPSDQRLVRIHDATDGLDVLGAGTSPMSRSGLALAVGGKEMSGSNCPAELPDGGSGTGDGGSSGSGTDTGGDSGTGSGGSSGGTAVDGGSGTTVGALSGFNISNTTTLGGTQRGRLLWREIVQ